MEELKSTEILEREIHEDARKKALRILKLSEDTINAQNIKWGQKLTENIENLEKKYAEEIKTEGDKVMSRLPVDKQRTKIKKIENTLSAAVNNWYHSLNRGQILDLLCGELTKISGQRAMNDGAAAKIYGLEIPEAEAILKRFNLTCAIEKIPSLSCYPAVIIDTDDVRITASIENVIDSLLDDKRAELVEALVGSDFLGDE